MHVTINNARERIEKECATAEQASNAGNEGMVRLCARRAAGVAIQHWLERNPHPDWGLDTMNRLRNLQREESIPQNVREAAKRLTEKVTAQFTPPSSTDPIHDARIIIDQLLR